MATTDGICGGQWVPDPAAIAIAYAAVSVRYRYVARLTPEVLGYIPRSVTNKLTEKLLGQRRLFRV